MKVAILCPGFGWVNRGVERVAQQVAGRLGGGFEPLIYNLRGVPLARGFADNGWNLRRIPAVPRTNILARTYAPLARRAGAYLWGPGDFEALTFSAALLPWLLRDRPEVVLNFAGPAAGGVCRALRRLRGTPFLHSAQGMAAGRLELIHARQNPDRYLATSLPNRQWIENEAPWLQTELVPNGVDCSLFRPDGESALPALNLNPPLILFVGAMDPVKRPELTVRAVARLSHELQSLRRPLPSLLMIGDGPIRRNVEALGYELLGERFRLLDSIDNQKLPAYYRAASIFTLPTEAEPFGIVFLEAMACGRPVVAHTGLVQPWLIGKAGVCCDCADEAQYAKAMLHTLDTDFGDMPRRRAQEFDLRAIVDKYARILSEVIQERRQ